MKKRTLTLEKLKVKSFTTSKQKSIKGGIETFICYQPTEQCPTDVTVEETCTGGLNTNCLVGP